MTFLAYNKTKKWSQRVHFPRRMHKEYTSTLGDGWLLSFRNNQPAEGKRHDLAAGFRGHRDGVTPRHGRLSCSREPWSTLPWRPRHARGTPFDNIGAYHSLDALHARQYIPPPLTPYAIDSNVDYRVRDATVKGKPRKTKKTGGPFGPPAGNRPEHNGRLPRREPCGCW